MPRSKLPSRKLLKKKLDTVVSNIVRRNETSCVVCGSMDRLTNGHVFSRKNESTRWDVHEDGNCHTQCWPCNYKHVYNTYPYFNWYIKRFGIKKFDKLYARWQKHAKNSRTDLIEKLEQLQKEYDKLENKFRDPFN